MRVCVCAFFVCMCIYLSVVPWCKASSSTFHYTLRPCLGISINRAITSDRISIFMDTDFWILCPEMMGTCRQLFVVSMTT